MASDKAQEPNVPVETQGADATARDSLPDLSEFVRSTGGNSDQWSFYRAWAWLVLAESRLSVALTSSVAIFQPLVKASILIGSNADLCDVVLPSGRISREHADLEFDFVHGHFYLTDRSSTNGTYVRPPGSSESRVITRQSILDGYRIRFADDVVFVFRCFAHKVAKL